MSFPNRVTPSPRLIALTIALTIVILCPVPAGAQSQQPAVFVNHYIALNAQFDNFPSVSALTVNPDGNLNFVGRYDTGDWPQAISITPDGRHLAIACGTASTTTEELRIFRVLPDATLQTVLVTTTPDSPLDLVWLRDDLLAVTETDCSGPNRVHVHHWDANSLALTPIDTEDTGGFNSALAVSPAGDLLFANDSPLSGAASIRVFRINPDGMLTLLATPSVASYPVKMCVSPDGAAIYVPNGIGSDGHRIEGYAIDPANGTLSPLFGSPFFSPGQSPKAVAMTADKSWAFAAHGTDATIQSFAVDPDTGAFTATGFSFDVGSQGDLAAIGVMDNLLFATKEFHSTALPRGLWVFQINQADGSFTPVGGINDTQGKRPRAFALWKPQATTGLPGDLNCDNVLNPDDIAPFALALSDPVAYAASFPGCDISQADMNEDGNIDGLDIGAFTEAILGP